MSRRMLTMDLSGEGHFTQDVLIITDHAQCLLAHGIKGHGGSCRTEDGTGQTVKTRIFLKAIISPEHKILEELKILVEPRTLVDNV